MQSLYKTELGLVVQLVTFPTADVVVASSILARSHTFVEIDHEIIPIDILLLPLNHERFLSVASESMCKKYWLTS